MTGDEIHITRDLKTNDLDSLKILNNAFVVEKDTLGQNNFNQMIDALVSGISLAQFCRENNVPCSRTFMRNVANDADRYQKYKDARALQAELLQDELIDLVNIQLPDDPKLAMAKVQLTRMQFDAKEKIIKQLAPYGVRNKPEDTAPKGQVSGNITISWEK